MNYRQKFFFKEITSRNNLDIGKRDRGQKQNGGYPVIEMGNKKMEGTR